MKFSWKRFKGLLNDKNKINKLNDCIFALHLSLDEIETTNVSTKNFCLWTMKVHFQLDYISKCNVPYY